MLVARRASDSSVGLGDATLVAPSPMVGCEGSDAKGESIPPHFRFCRLRPGPNAHDQIQSRNSVGFLTRPGFLRLQLDSVGANAFTGEPRRRLTPRGHV